LINSSVEKLIEKIWRSNYLTTATLGWVGRVVKGYRNKSFFSGTVFGWVIFCRMFITNPEQQSKKEMEARTSTGHDEDQNTLTIQEDGYQDST
jgi:hypothetical protein